MERVEATGDLEGERDLAFQRREWAVQRAAWAAMALVLLAALAGLFGSGPLSEASVEAGPLAVGYGRFQRRHAPEELVVAVAPRASAGGRVEVWLPAAYLGAIDVESVVPAPEAVRADGDRVVYAFAVDDPGQPLEATFSLEHDDVGVVHGGAGLVGGPEVAFRQVVYP